MSDIGIVYVAIGEQAIAAKDKAIKNLKASGCRYPFLVLSLDNLYGVEREELGNARFSRWVKINLDFLSPYRITIYLDADTEVKETLIPLVSPIRDGFNFVISPSSRQGEDVMGHIDSQEKSITLNELCYTPLALQAGVFAFDKSPETLSFFRLWRMEWERFKRADQGAMLRALNRSPLRVWLLGKDFNGGSVISHNFGAIAQRA